MLNNTVYRLLHDKKLTVGYFGGSITEGACASEERFCWRALCSAWLEKSFPDCAVTSVNAAIGGTGSDLGIFRLEHDLLSHKPDLIFLEFTTNDSGEEYAETLIHSETLVRKILAFNPYAEIVYVHTMTRGMAERLTAGGEIVSRVAHSAVMHHYGIPQIDVGEILRTRILAEGCDWKTYTEDNVHPNDQGYAIYADAVTAFLGERLLDREASALTPKQIPSPIGTTERMGAHLADAWEAANGEWTRAEESLCGRYPHYIEATVPGATLTYRFTGRAVGIYMMLAKDSGDLLFSIDGGEEESVRTWDSYCLRFNRAGRHLMYDALPFGEHTLTLRVADTKAEQSEGHTVRIGAFLIY